jgi:hypothetical protein
MRSDPKCHLRCARGAIELQFSGAGERSRVMIRQLRAKANQCHAELEVAHGLQGLSDDEYQTSVELNYSGNLEGLLDQIAAKTGLYWRYAAGAITLSRIDTQPVRLNVSLPSNLVQQIDAWAKAHHMTRSGFLASAASQAMATRS